MERNGRDRGRDEAGHRSSRERRSSRDRERSKKHRDRSRSRSRSKRKHHKTDVPVRSGSPFKPRAETPPEIREARERERELRELDRDTRTVFAYNLNLRADERDIFEFFSKAGKVVDVRIITDRNTRKSKGFAYIEFANREDIVNALALTGQTLMGQSVMVKSSEAEKNLAWEASQQQAQASNALNALAGMGAGPGAGPCKLFVSNLNPGVTDADLRQIFEPFGLIDFATLSRGASGRSEGAGFVQFQLMSDAMKAIQQLDNLEIAGSAIRVTIAAVSAGDIGPGTINESLDDAEDDGGGMKLTSQARAALMSRLAGAAGLPAGAAAALPPGPGMPGFAPAGGLPGPPPMMSGMAAGGMAAGAPPAYNPGLQLDQGLLGPASPIPTPCLLLKNMFDPASETEPDWDLEIAEDTKEECSKFGPVLHIHVDKNSQGFVYLKFAATEGAAAAQKALHGRWFAGRQVVAAFQFAPVYSGYFKC